MHGYLYQRSGLGGNEGFKFLKDGIHREIGNSNWQSTKTLNQTDILSHIVYFLHFSSAIDVICNL